MLLPTCPACQTVADWNEKKCNHCSEGLPFEEFQKQRKLINSQRKWKRKLQRMQNSIPRDAGNTGGAKSGRGAIHRFLSKARKSHPFMRKIARGGKLAFLLLGLMLAIVMTGLAAYYLVSILILNNESIFS